MIARRHGTFVWRPTWSATIVLSALLILGIGCSYESSADPPEVLDDLTPEDGTPDITAPNEIASGQLVLMFNAKDGVIRVARDEEILLQLHPEAFTLGLVNQLDEMANYDPWPLLTEDGLYTPIEGLRWLEITHFDVVETESGGVELTLYYPEDLTATVSIEALGTNRASLHWEASPEAQVGYMRIKARTDPEEGFYGLGEYFDQVNHRGKLRAMQLEPYGQMESKYNEAHVPVPFVIGTTGWGLFVESPLPGTIGCAWKEDDLLDVTFGTGMFSATDGLKFYLMVEDHPLDLTRHYYEVTGFPKLPARWALGPWIWRDENDDQAQVENDLDMIRELDLATTGYWIDRPYATAVNTFDYKESQFPDPDAMIAKMHAMGFRTALWHTPYLEEGHEATEDLVSTAKTEGYYPLTVGLLLNGWGRPIDLTNPDAWDWWQGLIHNYTDRGVEGFKLDYGEDIVPGFSSQRINIWEFHNGEDERTMHVNYTQYYHQVYAETLPEDGGFLLCRHGVYGDQTNGVIIWPGDLDADMSLHGEFIEKEDGDSYYAVGGQPAALIGGLTLGPSGFPFYGSDTGGYQHSPPDEETFIRWFESTAVGSVMQIGTSSNDVAWEFFNETNDPDGEKLGWYRMYTRLHLQLFPYEWTYVQKLLEDGRALQRSLGLAYPEMGVHPSDHYLFGDDLLVAPVVKRNVTEKDVIFPEGSWVDWFTGDVFQGGQTHTVAAPLGKLPLYLRQGGIVPLLRPTIDTMAPTDYPDEIDSFATTPGMLYPVVYPGTEQSTFTVYDGAEITTIDGGDSMTLTWSDGSEFKYGAHFVVVAFGDTKPASVTLDGTALDEIEASQSTEGEFGWFHTPEEGGKLHIQIDAGTHEVVVTR